MPKHFTTHGQFRGENRMTERKEMSYWMSKLVYIETEDM